MLKNTYPSWLQYSSSYLKLSYSIFHLSMYLIISVNILPLIHAGFVNDSSK